MSVVTLSEAKGTMLGYAPFTVFRVTLTTLLALALACSPSRREEPPAVEPNIDPVALPRSPVRVPSLDSAPAPAPEPVERIAPPERAYASGWMPLASTGADRFVRMHPTFDGRGVVIGVLDTGIDPAIPGLGTTSSGDPKLLDFRDFSGEGAVPLVNATPVGDTIVVGARRLRGFGRVRALNAEGPWYVGTFAELPLGDPPAADLNGNGAVADTLALVVTRATDGWVVLADTDGNGSLAGERAVRDFLVGREWFGWARRGRTPRIGVAANFTDAGGVPTLGLAFDLS
ncbi:MAG: S8 family serine peptidase, partial [Gemmatimonadales bacterium]|nr:S8 family serine peptidase [Gemmatimonadales bacterium]